MPEGDTIYRTARALQKALGGRVVTGFETGHAKLASANDNAPVVGRVVEKVEARGKWCLIFFSGDLILLSHMLMSGSWHIYRTGERWKMPHRAMRVVVRVGAVVDPQGLKPANFSAVTDGTAEAVPLRVGEAGGNRADGHSHPTHAIEPHGWGTQENSGEDEKRGFPLGTQNKINSGPGFEAVLFNAQVAEFHTARSLERYSMVPKLGPDVLGEDFTVDAGIAAMRRRIASHPGDEVAVALLNQRVLAGLGNVYKSEIPFMAGVNPFRALSTLTDREVDKMVELSLRFMKANVNIDLVRGESGEGIVTYTGARRTTGAMQQSDRVWVYGRQGKECRRCGTPVMRRLQGEQARPTYWCPVCQPWVAAEGQSAEAPVGRKILVNRRKIGC